MLPCASDRELLAVHASDNFRSGLDLINVALCGGNPDDVGRMRIIKRYLLSSFSMSFFVTLLVLTLVLSIGAIFKMTELITRGVPWGPLVRIVGYNIPNALVYSIPMSTMISTLLVFGRLSSDSEITAMKSCGIGIWSIAKGPLLFAGALSALCLYIQSTVVPYSYERSKTLLHELRLSTPLAILEEGRFVQPFAGYSVYIGSRDGDVLQDVRIYQLLKNRKKRKIRAKTGQVRMDEKTNRIIVDLTDVRIDPFMEDRPGIAYLKEWSLPFPARKPKPGKTKKPGYYTWPELITVIRNPGLHFPLLSGEDLQAEWSRLTVEFHLRLVTSLSCLVFALLGVPLGVTTHRKESSLGVAMSLLIIMVFHMFIIAGQSLSRQPEFIPHIILWVPIALGEMAGIIMMRRAD